MDAPQLGDRIRIFSPSADCFLSATIIDASQGLHRVEYDHHDFDILDLRYEYWHYLPSTTISRRPPHIQPVAKRRALSTHTPACASAASTHSALSPTPSPLPPVHLFPPIAPLSKFSSLRNTHTELLPVLPPPRSLLAATPTHATRPLTSYLPTTRAEMHSRDTFDSPLPTFTYAPTHAALPSSDYPAPATQAVDPPFSCLPLAAQQIHPKCTQKPRVQPSHTQPVVTPRQNKYTPPSELRGEKRANVLADDNAAAQLLTSLVPAPALIYPVSARGIGNMLATELPRGVLSDATHVQRAYARADAFGVHADMHRCAQDFARGLVVDTPAVHVFEGLRGGEDISRSACEVPEKLGKANFKICTAREALAKRPDYPEAVDRKHDYWPLIDVDSAATEPALLAFLHDHALSPAGKQLAPCDSHAELLAAPTIQTPPVIKATLNDPHKSGGDKRARLPANAVMSCLDSDAVTLEEHEPVIEWVHFDQFGARLRTESSGDSDFRSGRRPEFPVGITGGTHATAKAVDSKLGLETEGGFNLEVDLRPKLMKLASEEKVSEEKASTAGEEVEKTAVGVIEGNEDTRKTDESKPIGTSSDFSRVVVDTKLVRKNGQMPQEKSPPAEPSNPTATKTRGTMPVLVETPVLSRVYQWSGEMPHETKPPLSRAPKLTRARLPDRLRLGNEKDSQGEMKYVISSRLKKDIVRPQSKPFLTKCASDETDSIMSPPDFTAQSKTAATCAIADAVEPPPTPALAAASESATVLQPMEKSGPVIVAESANLAEKAAPPIPNSPVLTASAGGTEGSPKEISSAHEQSASHEPEALITEPAPLRTVAPSHPTSISQFLASLSPLADDDTVAASGPARSEVNKPTPVRKGSGTLKSSAPPIPASQRQAPEPKWKTPHERPIAKSHIIHPAHVPTKLAPPSQAIHTPDISEKTQKGLSEEKIFKAQIPRRVLQDMIIGAFERSLDEHLSPLADRVNHMFTQSETQNVKSIEDTNMLRRRIATNSAEVGKLTKAASKFVTQQEFAESISRLGEIQQAVIRTFEEHVRERQIQTRNDVALMIREEICIVACRVQRGVERVVDNVVVPLLRENVKNKIT